MSDQALILQMSINVEHDDDGFFHSYCPAFQELHARGSTEPEAMKHVEDAIVVHLRSLVQHGEPLPRCSMKSEHVPGGGPGVRAAVFQFV